MKKREIYLRAAESIDRRRNYYSCVATTEASLMAGLSNGTQLACEYADLFAPPGHRGPFWGSLWPTKGRRACRVLALCFMAAIVGDEEVV